MTRVGFMILRPSTHMVPLSSILKPSSMSSMCSHCMTHGRDQDLEWQSILSRDIGTSTRRDEVLVTRIVL